MDLESKIKELEARNDLQLSLLKKDLKEVHNSLSKNEKGI